MNHTILDIRVYTSIKPLNLNDCFTYRQFNIQQFYVLPTQCVYVFCVDLRTNSDYFPIQHSLTGLYNRDGVCLLSGTNWVFKCNLGYMLYMDLRTAIFSLYNIN